MTRESLLWWEWLKALSLHKYYLFAPNLRSLCKSFNGKSNSSRIRQSTSICNANLSFRRDGRHLKWQKQISLEANNNIMVCISIYQSQIVQKFIYDKAFSFQYGMVVLDIYTLVKKKILCLKPTMQYGFFSLLKA